ncbi:MAG TPA: response regulator, partial [Chitinophagaceae bacterium]|nr:response regulator [Chitinophagaceae bacterium]
MKPIRHILLMDDDLDDCDIFTEALAEAARGIRLTCRQNPEEALEDIPSLEPDLIFLDINMPRKNGFECLKDLKSGEDSRHIPVVMYSNSGRP